MGGLVLFFKRNATWRLKHLGKSGAGSTAKVAPHPRAPFLLLPDPSGGKR